MIWIEAPRRRMYLGTFISNYREALWNGHVTLASAGVHNARNFNYVMKLETRLAGPWKDEEFNLEEMPVLTRQLVEFQEMPLRPWQRQVQALLELIDDRQIIFIHDRVGNSGKRIFTEWLEYHEKAHEVRPIRGAPADWDSAGAFGVPLMTGIHQAQSGCPILNGAQASSLGVPLMIGAHEAQSGHAPIKLNDS